MINKEQLIALFKDEAFVKELNAARNEEECLALFAAKGIETTIDELKGLNSSEELSVDELETVTGGFSICCGLGTSYGAKAEACWDLNGEGAVACYYIGVGLGMTNCKNQAIADYYGIEVE